MKELKKRLQNAAGNRKDLPQVFWYAVANLMVELHIDCKSEIIARMMEVFRPYRIPAVVQKLYAQGYFHPGCFEDLKTRAEYEFCATVLHEPVQKMFDALYECFERKCMFTFWERTGVTKLQACFDISYYRRGELEDFCNNFCKIQQEEPVIPDDYFPRTFREQACVFKKCWSNNISAEESKKLLLRLRKGGVTGFLICALHAHSFPERVVEQIEQTDFLHGTTEDQQRLSNQWVRMILFASKIKPGMKYYVPDITATDKVREFVWKDGDIDNYMFKRGLYFAHKEEAVMLANEVLNTIQDYRRKLWKQKLN